MEEVMKILLNIQGDLQSQKKDMKEMGENIKNSINKNIEEKFQQINSKITKLEQKVEEQQKVIEFLDKQIRRKNIVFFGVKETEMNYDDLLTIVLEIINKNMCVLCKPWEIESVARIGKKTDKKIRPIVVTLTTLGRKLEILRNKKQLKNSNIYIQEDFPRQVLEIRKELQKELEEERNAGNKVYLSYDKIIKIKKPGLEGIKNYNDTINNNKRFLSESPEVAETLHKSTEEKQKQVSKKSKNSRPQDITKYLQETPPNKEINKKNFKKNLDIDNKISNSTPPPSPSRSVTVGK